MRHHILNNLTASLHLAADVDLKHVAIQTAGLVAQDLVSLVASVTSASFFRVVSA